jgi:hypothetical protein
MRPAKSVGCGLRHVLPVLLCALGGHLALYGTLLPSGGGHAYFGWYEPLVAGLSVGALAVLAGLLIVAAFGGEALRRRVVPVLLPAAERPLPGTVRAVRLALASVGFLLCQETLERTLSEGRLAAAAFSPSQALIVLAAIGAAAAVLALVERSCSQLIALVAPRRLRLRIRVATVSFPPARPLLVRRRNPLADLRGLRAPPLPA